MKQGSSMKAKWFMTTALQNVSNDLFFLPWPASAQSTVKYVGSKALRPVLATPGPETLTLLGWQPAPIFIWGSWKTKPINQRLTQGVRVRKVDRRGWILCSHPEWAVRDVDASPGDHCSVLHRLTWSVRTRVGTISIVLHLYVHRSAFAILKMWWKGKPDNELTRTVRNPADQSVCLGATHTNLSKNLQGSFSSLLGINCELGGLSNGQAAALKARAVRLHLNVYTKQCQVWKKLHFFLLQPPRCVGGTLPPGCPPCLGKSLWRAGGRSPPWTGSAGCLRSCRARARRTPRAQWASSRHHRSRRPYRRTQSWPEMDLPQRNLGEEMNKICRVL